MSSKGILPPEGLFSHEARFVLGATKISSLPSTNIPEIAFIGRSNVGKSSIINSIIGRKVARVSNTPGRTQELNFFSIGGQFHIVDLPGYGYAKASKRNIAGWNDLVFHYLASRIELKRIFMLLDSRFGFKPNDIEMVEFLGNYSTLIQIVLTKADKIGKTQLELVHSEVKEEIKKHAICHNIPLVTSSAKKLGMEDLKLAIYESIK